MLSRGNCCHKVADNDYRIPKMLRKKVYFKVV